MVDISMPELNGVDVTKQIKRALPETKLLVLSSYDDLECVDEVIAAGATGFVSKRSAANLPEAIRAVRLGKSFFSAEITSLMKNRKKAALKFGDTPFALTTRQEEVLQLIAEGLSNKAIAGQLGISIKTVEKHRQMVMDRLHIHDVAGLTRHAIKKGMVSEPVPIQMGEGPAKLIDK